jgi:plasmid stabilization system protein ParE
MARVQITVRALADLERLFDFLAEHNPKLARERMLSVRRAFELLADHPLLGRQAEDPLGLLEDGRVKSGHWTGRRRCTVSPLERRCAASRVGKRPQFQWHRIRDRR